MHVSKASPFGGMGGLGFFGDAQSNVFTLAEIKANVNAVKRRLTELTGDLQILDGEVDDAMVSSLRKFGTAKNIPQLAEIDRDGVWEVVGERDDYAALKKFLGMDGGKKIKIAIGASIAAIALIALVS